MNTSVPSLAIVVAAGAIGSACLLPMKFVRRWQWENTWLVYSSLAYLLFPLLTAWYFVPQLSRVYAEAGSATVARVVLFGFGWGLSVVMLGLAVAAVGLAVSTGIILGCSIAIGSLAPLLILGSENLFTSSGIRIVLADLIVVAGVILCARAGYLRDRNPNSHNQSSTFRWGGLLLCFIAGVLTPLLNLALSSGAPITELAIKHGAEPHQATNGVWGLAVCAGSLPSIFYCALLLGKKKTWKEFGIPVSGLNLLLCFFMATFFIVSTIGYGIGAVQMGKFGPVIGWPVYISSIIIGNNFWGWLTNEWVGAPKRAAIAMLSGIGLQVLGILLLARVAPI